MNTNVVCNIYRHTLSSRKLALRYKAPPLTQLQKAADQLPALIAVEKNWYLAGFKSCTQMATVRSAASRPLDSLAIAAAARTHHTNNHAAWSL
jgi:hypothetical protein